MATAIQTEKLLTVEEYARRPENGKREELVRGRIVELNVPYLRHGQLIFKVVGILQRYLDANDIGQLMCGDVAVITERGPDTIRGADVAFMSYARRPKGPLPRAEYITEVPELVFEVRSPSDRWREVIAKAMEYLGAGAKCVCVLDEQTHTARLYTSDAPEQVLNAHQELSFPDILPGFAVKVERFFE
jgi:Uma2 family endonuclease